MKAIDYCPATGQFHATLDGRLVRRAPSYFAAEFAPFPYDPAIAVEAADLLDDLRHGPFGAEAEAVVASFGLVADPEMLALDILEILDVWSAGSLAARLHHICERTAAADEADAAASLDELARALAEVAR